MDPLVAAIQKLTIQPPVPRGTGAVDEPELLRQATTMDETKLRATLKYLDENYHNNISLISDDTYDQLLELYENRFGEYSEIGAPPRGQKIDLPFYLGSLKKIKTEAEIRTWTSRFPGPYILEDKVDGITLLYISQTVGGRRVYKMYTRGGGTQGLDVSHIIDVMKMPKVQFDMAVRGEAVMSKEAFARVGGGFSNARNMVSGLINAKESFNPQLVSSIQFLAFRLVELKDPQTGLPIKEPPETEILRLKSFGFTTPWAARADTLTLTQLQSVLQQRRQEAPYEVDGLVVYQNRSADYPIGEKPSHVVAFKMNLHSADTTVIEVVWEASKDRLLKPVIIYEPVILSGATLQRTSGDNARYIVTNGIGPGAKIRITRSGDTIPRIVEVLQPVQPQLPDPRIHGQYAWNANQVEFVLLQDNPQVTAAKIEHFLETLGVKNVGPARVKAFVEGGLNSITAILTATPQQFAQVERIGINLANQIYTEIQTKIKSVPLARLMAASGFFSGFGEKRLQALIDVYPNVIQYVNVPTTQLTAAIEKVPGFGDKLASEFAQKLPEFVQWWNKNPMITLASVSQTPMPSGPQTLTGITVVFSGFRDKQLQERIEQRGGKVGNAISKSTNYLIMKDPQDIKGKAQKAASLGVPVISRDQFIAQFLN